MVKKTNVGSVAMCIYGQVVSFSMDHPKLRRQFLKVEEQVSITRTTVPLLEWNGNCVYSGGYMLICIVSPFDIPCSG